MTIDGLVLNGYAWPMASVLVVDDSSELRALMTIAFEGEGYQVTVAANGREALEALEIAKPTFIVLDLMMPIMNGAEFLAAVGKRADLRGIPVVICSALPESGHPCVGYLTKPIDLLALRDIARKMQALT